MNPSFGSAFIAHSSSFVVLSSSSELIVQSSLFVALSSLFVYSARSTLVGEIEPARPADQRKFSMSIRSPLRLRPTSPQKIIVLPSGEAATFTCIAPGGKFTSRPKRRSFPLSGSIARSGGLALGSHGT